jgi:predicted ribosomally synthesized peptide with nif11-like leader
MSIETAKQFLTKAQSDAALQARLQAINSDSKEQILAELLPIAAAAGFNFSAQDYEAAVDEILQQKHAAGESDDAELETVSGGARRSVFHTIFYQVTCSKVPCR